MINFRNRSGLKSFSLRMSLCSTVSIMAFAFAAGDALAQQQPSVADSSTTLRDESLIVVAQQRLEPDVVVTEPQKKPSVIAHQKKLPRATSRKRTTRRTASVSTTPVPALAAGQTPAAPSQAHAVLNPDGSTTASGGFYVETPTFGPFGNIPDKDIPFSTNTISKQIIDDQQVHSANDALKNDSSVNSFPMTAGYAQNHYIRGFEVGPQNGIYQDGLDLLGYVSPFVETDQRIDIMRGAVAALYGFAAPAGVVNFISKMPLDAPLTRVDLGYISRGSFYGATDFSRRFGENGQFGIRLNLYEQDGITPIDQTSANRGAQSLSLDWKPDSDLKLWAKVEHSNVDVQGNNSTFFLPTSPYVALPAAPDPSKLYGQPWFHDNNENFLTETGAEFKRDGWTVTGAVGYSQTSRSFLNNFDNPALNTAGVYGLDYVYGNLSDENFAYRSMISKEFAVGVVDQTISLIVDGSTHSYLIGQVTSPYGMSNIWNPVYVPQPNLLAIPPILKQDMTFDTQILSDKIDITKYFTIYAGGVHSSVDEDSFSLPSNVQTTSIQQDAYTPMAAVIFKPWERVSIYASYIEALQPGSQAPGTAVNAYQLLSPFVGKQYEGGVKAELMPGLETNAAVFKIDQAYAFLNSANVYTASGTQENQGVELSATGRITSDLVLRTGLTAMTARIQGGTQDGQEAAGVSQFRANLFAEYTLPIFPQLTLMGGVYYQDRFVVGYNTPANIAAGYLPIVYAPGYETFDIGAKYSTTLWDKPITYRLYIANLFNRAYWQSTNGGANVQVGQPLTAKLSASVRF
ncbi:MAG: TonB-dependent siderophore receptor [Bradyrhizobium sp.]|nr:TonB-dependent siderophore receptor [Bradyrhizobium sp.]